MSKTHPVGTIEHALAHAVQCLGMEAVAGICDRSASAIYRGINPDDPLKLSWLTVEHMLALGQALLARNKPEFFSSAIRQQMESGVFAEGYGFESLESPTLTLAEAGEQISRALRLVAGSLGRGDQSERLREEQAVMIVEALESAMSYAKRAKMAVLRYTREVPPRPKEAGPPGHEDADPAPPSAAAGREGAKNIKPGGDPGARSMNLAASAAGPRKTSVA